MNANPAGTVRQRRSKGTQAYRGRGILSAGPGRGGMTDASSEPTPLVSRFPTGRARGEFLASVEHCCKDFHGFGPCAVDGDLKVLRFEHCNESESWRQAVRLRGYGWAGYRIGMPTLHYWGAGAVMPEGFAGRKIRLDRALRREVYVDAVQQDELSMRATADLIARMRPHAIIAYTQALALFARWVDEHRRRDWPDIRVLCCAEGLMSRDRDALERVFGPGVYETYGSRETMLIASECDAHAGLHLCEENVVAEVARDGKPVAPGVAGDVLVTDLHNYGMPFIRYVNGDMAAMAEDGVCPCGRTLRKLARVEGRRMDTLRDGNGNAVPGMLFASLLQLDAGALRAFQVVQKRSGEVELKVVRGREWNEERFKAASRRLKGYFKGLPFKVTFCEEIPASKSGKRRPIVVETGDA